MVSAQPQVGTARSASNASLGAMRVSMTVLRPLPLGASEVARAIRTFFNFARAVARLPANFPRRLATKRTLVSKTADTARVWVIWRYRLKGHLTCESWH